MNRNIAYLCNKNGLVSNLMNTMSLNNVWSYLQGLSLSASNQRWLGERLIEASAMAKDSLSDDEKKLKKLNSLFGVWAGSDGERIEKAIRDSRNAGYERKLESLNS